MAEVIVSRNMSGDQTGNQRTYGRAPKATIHDALGQLVYTIPWAGEVQHADVHLGIVEQERAVGKPLTIPSRGRNEKMNMEFPVGRLDRQESIEADLQTLEQLAKMNQDVYVVYGPTESGRWRITNFNYTVTARTLNNEASRANVTIEFTEPNLPTKIASPVSGGAYDNELKYPIIARPSTYKVKKGDTLSTISIRYYGSTAYVTSIAKANKITTNTRLKTGRKLKLP